MPIILRNLGIREGHTLMLLVVQVLAFFHDRLVKALGRIVGLKCLDVALERDEVGLIDEGLAKLDGLVEHGAGFEGGMHTI